MKHNAGFETDGEGGIRSTCSCGWKHKWMTLPEFQAMTLDEWEQHQEANEEHHHHHPDGHIVNHTMAPNDECGGFRYDNDPWTDEWIPPCYCGVST